MLKSKANKIILLTILVFFFIPNWSCAQELPPPYIPKNWESFKNLPDHLTDATGYIGRLYQYDGELWFNDKDGDASQVTNQLTNELLYYTPEAYGAEGDGAIDDTTAFNSLITAMGSNDAVVYLANTYYLNTANGLTFTNKVKIFGPGGFIIGSSVGNSPAITISGNKSYLADFDIVGDHTNFNNDNFSTELRRSIKITANYVICDNLTDTNSIVGIELSGANHCSIKNCNFINDIIKAGDGVNNYHAAIRIDSSSYCKVSNNKFSGYGNPILHGGSSYYNILNSNSISNGDNNGIYISSGQWCVITGNVVMGCDGTSIRTRDSYHLISDNLVDANGWAGGVTGINITGNGTPDANGYNGEQVIVVGNTIRGLFTNGIGSAIQDSGYLKNPLIVGNSIETEDDPNELNYGIHIDGRSIGMVLSNNTIKNADYGIYVSVDDANTDTHVNGLISENHITDTETYPIITDYMSESKIIGNAIYDSPQYVIKITNATHLDISENIIEDWYHATSAHVAISIGGTDHTIKNNYIERTAWGGYAYGIRLENQTDRVSIIGNTFVANDYGILFLMGDANTDYHRHAIVTNNYFVDSNFGGIYGVELHSCMIAHNGFYDTGEEPILFTDSNNVTISYNLIKDSGDSGHDLLDEAITVKGNSYEIIGNLIEVEDSSAIYGIVAYGDGAADANNYNGYDTVIKDNHIIGPFATGIATAADGGYYLKNPKVVNNTIEIESGGAYGIRFDGRTSKASVVGNNISGHSIGIYLTVDDPNTDTHSGMLIKANDVSGGTNDGIILNYAIDSLVTDNVCMNAAANRSGISMLNTTYCRFVDNMVGDNQSTATQKYGITESTGSDNNIFINNDGRSLTSYEYQITGTSSVVESDEVVVETDDGSGTRTFEIGEFKTIVIDPNGGGINLNPRAVTWPRVNELIVVNTANAAETITFDSTGLNQAIAQSERGIFVYDGSNWLKVYVGS